MSRETLVGALPLPVVADVAHRSITSSTATATCISISAELEAIDAGRFIALFTAAMAAGSPQIPVESSPRLISRRDSSRFDNTEGGRRRARIDNTRTIACANALLIFQIDFKCSSFCVLSPVLYAAVHMTPLELPDVDDVGKLQRKLPEV